MSEPESGLEYVARDLARAYKAVRRVLIAGHRHVAAFELRVLGTKRRRFLASGLTVVLVVAIIGTTVTVSTINEQNRAIAAAAAEKKADLAEAAAKAAAEAKAAAARKVVAAKDLADAKARSVTVSEDAVAQSAAAAAWGDPAVLAEIESARLALLESAKGSDAPAMNAAATAVNTALVKIGTIEDSQDRAYAAARAAVGRPLTDSGYAVTTARSYCTQLDASYSADVMGAVYRFTTNWNSSSEDLQAIAILCPQYQAAVDAAIFQVDDGKYSVGAEATPFGVSPRVIAAGTYRIESASDCYWARSTSSGELIDNDFISNAPGAVTVRINAGEGFESSRCPAWVKQ
ncbi:DUF732 domain-containing protein [Cryobacterium sp. TMT1-66-1]|uniref:DUF732 domain-containing protein n=1 Tax=Cryobacterium sp. TMT1-66-1 TaxID=1259242 RepID=UPI0010691BBC|nr:DUF732 domain-containing protein [Cryobacterium sp. TMT1-66-1]TFD04122.1 hypothetical protein E3T29_15830 [Cryobacterium sp. TMT1-66-1]